MGLPKEAGVTFDGKVVSIKDGISIEGKPIALGLDIEIEPATGAVKKETLIFNAQTVEISSGRLFLADMTVDPPTWEQVNARLPTHLPDPEKMRTVRKLAKKLIQKLQRENTTVREFLQGLEEIR